MGNSPSSPSSELSASSSAAKLSHGTISGPVPIRAGSRSRRTVQDDSVVAHNNSLSPPSMSHRRTRSAELVSDPPPPYSRITASGPLPPLPDEAINGSSSPISNNAGLGTRHTQVFSTNSTASTSTSNRPTGRSNSYLRAPMRRNTAENALEMLRKYDTLIIVDDSLSMAGSRWKEAREALASLAETAGKYDTDGIDVYFLNDTKVGKYMKSATAVRTLFNDVAPCGATPIGGKLEELLLEYLSSIDAAKDTGEPAVLKAIKPINYIVITDGVPTDEPEDVIVNAARRLDARSFPVTQLGIQFVQIGNDHKATQYLEELDNDLAEKYHIRDIVDTTPYTGGYLTAELLTKILIGGINRRVDRRGAEAVMM